jgi:hypothetical protein
LTLRNRKSGYREREGDRAWRPEKLIELERAAMEKMERTMEDLAIWGREGSEVIGSG